MDEVLCSVFQHTIEQAGVDTACGRSGQVVKGPVVGGAASGWLLEMYLTIFLDIVCGMI